MPFETIFRAFCDVCGASDEEANIELSDSTWNKSAVAKKFRDEGWSIGAKVRCPKCTTKKAKTKKPKKSGGLMPLADAGEVEWHE